MTLRGGRARRRRTWRRSQRRRPRLSAARTKAPPSSAPPSADRVSSPGACQVKFAFLCCSAGDESRQEERSEALIGRRRCQRSRVCPLGLGLPWATRAGCRPRWRGSCRYAWSAHSVRIGVWAHELGRGAALSVLSLVSLRGSNGCSLPTPTAAASPSVRARRPSPRRAGRLLTPACIRAIPASACRVCPPPASCQPHGIPGTYCTALSSIHL